MECMAGLCEGECVGHRPGDEPLTLTKCHNCELPQLYESLEGWKSVCGIKGNISFFQSFSFSDFLLSLI